MCELAQKVTPKLDKAIAHFEGELSSIRTGRAHVGMLDGVMVESYGTMQPLKAVASITVPDGHSLAVTPWDKGMLSVVEKAIRDNQALGLNPMNDGAVVRMNVPSLTEERRRDMVKLLGTKVEDCRVAMRNARHEVLGEAKRMVQAKEATQDDVKSLEQDLSKLLDKYQAKLEELETAKTKELMAV